jgi:EAL domain-containing protein (putative c-di-GMP-specific phosphodiesterase class I)
LRALRKAIEDHQRWRKAGLEAPRIAVNVSPQQLRDKKFVAEIEERISIRQAGALQDLRAGIPLPAFLRSAETEPRK